jgi:hypothetical protein
MRNCPTQLTSAPLNYITRTAVSKTNLPVQRKWSSAVDRRGNKIHKSQSTYNKSVACYWVTLASGLFLAGSIHPPFQVANDYINAEDTSRLQENLLLIESSVFVWNVAKDCQLMSHIVQRFHSV